MWADLPYQKEKPAGSAKLRYAELISGQFMPVLQAALRPARVIALAFQHHKAQEKLATWPASSSDWHANSKPEERCGGE